MSYADERIAIILGIAVVVLYVILLAVAVADYVMTSLSLYTLAKRRGIRGAGLAWVPVANYWIIGSLANEIDNQKGMARKWNVVLLSLAAIGLGGVLVAYAALIVAGIVYAFVAMDSLLLLVLPFYILLILAMVVSVALSICSAVCIYKIFESTVPEKAVKYLLLYLLVPLGAGICMMKARNCGYPYRFPPVAAEAEE